MAPPSFAFALMRTAVLGLAAKHPHVRSLINPRQTSAIAYLDSGLNFRCTAGPDTFVAGPAPGAVLPECPLMRIVNGQPQAAHVTDLLIPGFTVLHFNHDGVIPAAVLQACRAAIIDGVPVQVVAIARSKSSAAADATVWDNDGKLFATYGATDGCAYLIRPDGHVAARWRECPSSEITDAIAHVLSRETLSGETV